MRMSDNEPEYITDSKEKWWDHTVEKRHGSLPEGEVLVSVNCDFVTYVYQILDFRFDEFKEWALVTWASEVDVNGIVDAKTPVDTLLDALEIVIEEVE